MPTPVAQLPVCLTRDSLEVVSAPTGSGKTVVLELAILRMLAAANLSPAGRWDLQAGRSKAIYVAPTRALVQERVRDWSARFGYLSIKVLECTGDMAEQDTAGLLTADIIATTPCATLADRLQGSLAGSRPAC